MDKRLNWNTLMTGWLSPAFITAHHGLNSLSIRIQDGGSKGSGKVCLIEWTDFCAFRSTQEEHRYPWVKDDTDDFNSVPTSLIDSSSWIDQLRDEGGLLDDIYPGAKHFAIYTTSFWIEVISKQDPAIQLIDNPETMERDIFKAPH